MTTWSEGETVRQKLCGCLGELQRTFQFVSSSGLQLWWRSQRKRRITTCPVHGRGRCKQTEQTRQHRPSRLVTRGAIGRKGKHKTKHNTTQLLALCLPTAIITNHFLTARWTTHSPVNTWRWPRTPCKDTSLTIHGHHHQSLTNRQVDDIQSNHQVAMAEDIV